jgi:hypothetical protein
MLILTVVVVARVLVFLFVVLLFVFVLVLVVVLVVIVVCFFVVAILVVLVILVLILSGLLISSSRLPGRHCKVKIRELSFWQSSMASSVGPLEHGRVCQDVGYNSSNYGGIYNGTIMCMIIMIMCMIFINIRSTI